jgi:hypothetical protein
MLIDGLGAFKRFLAHNFLIIMGGIFISLPSNLLDNSN